MRICIDITEMYKVDFVSGIQRVVIEVTTRWIQDGKNLLLLVYDSKQNCFIEVDNNKYYEFYTKKSGSKDYLMDQNYMNITDFGENDVFFDMDSVWMNPLKRSYLLPEIKKTGCKIAAHIYDIIPVTDAQYCHEFTTLSFLEYIGAQLENADLIISNAQATIDAIEELIRDTEISGINGVVVTLGSDIKPGDKSASVRDFVKKIPEKGKYVLMVGTMEPRKNHRYVLNAFEKVLFDQGINLVFAGRIGWNVDELIKDVKAHEKLGTQLFFENGLSDGEITYLYEHCMLVAFPSFNEGFGLPIIEAFAKGAPVLAADIPVLKEVGGEYCKYFSLDDVNTFADLVKNYIENPEVYKQDKEKIKSYRRYTWDECAESMYDALCCFERKSEEYV